MSFALATGNEEGFCKTKLPGLVDFCGRSCYRALNAVNTVRVSHTLLPAEHRKLTSTCRTCRETISPTEARQAHAEGKKVL